MPLFNPDEDERVALPHEAPADPSTPASGGSNRGNLGAIQVSDELATLFHEARDLLQLIKNDPGVPANQRAQVLNTTLSVLERISKTRTDLYNSERVRNIEQTLIRVMKEQPQEVREAFFAKYEAALAG